MPDAEYPFERTNDLSLKTFTLGYWAILPVMLLAGPTWAQPAWQWAAGGQMGNTGTGFCMPLASVGDAAGNTVVAGSFASPSH